MSPFDVVIRIELCIVNLFDWKFNEILEIGDDAARKINKWIIWEEQAAFETVISINNNEQRVEKQFSEKMYIEKKCVYF